MRPTLLLLALLLLLNSCIFNRSRPTRTYLLSPVGFQETHEFRSMVKLGRIRLPGYLNTNNLIRRHGTHEVIVDSYSLWAESLTSSISDILCQNLGTLLPQTVIIPPDSTSPADSLLIDCTFKRFEAQDDCFEVSASCLCRQGTSLRWTRQIQFSLPLAAPTDPATIVQVHNEALGKIALELAKSLAGVSK